MQNPYTFLSNRFISVYAVLFNVAVYFHIECVTIFNVLATLLFD